MARVQGEKGGGGRDGEHGRKGDTGQKGERGYIGEKGDKGTLVSNLIIFCDFFILCLKRQCNKIFFFVFFMNPCC